jgi:hypothetical protein
MWKKYFRVIKIVPGKVVTPLFGELDFSRDNIPLEKIIALFENNFPYLQLTPEGEQTLYGVPAPEPSDTTPTKQTAPKKTRKDKRTPTI